MCGHPIFSGFGWRQPDFSVVKFPINIANGPIIKSIGDSGLTQLFHLELQSYAFPVLISLPRLVAGILMWRTFLH